MGTNLPDDPFVTEFEQSRIADAQIAKGGELKNTIVVVNELGPETPPTDTEGDLAMGFLKSGRESRQASPKKREGSRGPPDTEESVRKRLQEKIFEAEALRRERDQYKRDFQERQDYADYANACLDLRHAEIHRVEVQLKEAREKAKQAGDWSQTFATTQREHEAERSRLQKQIDDLKRALDERGKSEQQARSELKEAQDHIFQLQPRRVMITETEAQGQFEDLFNGIQRWVENRLVDILDELDDGKLSHRQCPPEVAHCLLSLTGERARRDFRSDGSDEFHILAIIMQYLIVNLFNKDFYCPLDGQGLPTGEDPTLTTIRKIESAMAKTDRDVGQVRDWRFEALNALVSQPDFEERRRSFHRHLTDDLTRLFSILVPQTSPAELKESIGLNIVRPAMDVAQRLQLSTNLYTLRWTPYNNDVKTGPVNEAKHDFSHYICMNLLQRGKAIAPGTNRLRVTYLFDVCPGLYCESIENGVFGHPRTVCRPKVLVAASEGKQVLPTPGRTILDWMDHCAKNPAPAPAPQAKPLPPEPDVQKKVGKRKHFFSRS